MRVLVAGITGQLGAGIREVADSVGIELVSLIRPLAGRSAAARARRLDRDAPRLADDVLQGDVRLPLWGLDGERIAALAGEVDAVLNVAAETNWAASPAHLSAVNFLGAVNGRRLAAALRERHERCAAYVHASSIHVAGDQTGSIAEVPLGASASRTPYEQSKWLGECALLERSHAEDGLAIGIARMGGLLGNSITGATARRHSLYLLADRWDRLPGRVLPVAAAGRVDMLPRDHAAAALLRFLQSVVRMASPEVQLVHVCAGESAPTILALLAALSSGDRFGVRRPLRTVRVSPSHLLFLSRHVERFVELPPGWQNLVTGTRYLALDRVFERARLTRLIGDQLPSASIELIVRLTFALERARPPAWEHDRPLARFAG